MHTRMSKRPSITAGQVLTGALFNEPMRVETVSDDGNGAVVVGLVGTKSEKFRTVRLTPPELEDLTILETAASFKGDGKFRRLGGSAHLHGIAYEFYPYFAFSISRVDPLPHQLEAIYDYL